MPDETIHDEIESWLAGDVHDQLSCEERAAFQRHLAGCAACRALQQEEKQMHQLLENTLATESADPAFGQRMVRRFRDKMPAPNGGLISFCARLMRTRGAQVAAVAALLLALVQVGKMVTGERGVFPRSRSTIAFTPPARDEKSAATEATIVTDEVAQAKKDYRSTDTLSLGAGAEIKKSLADKLEPPAAPSYVLAARE